MNLPDISQFLETAVIAGGDTQTKANKTISFQFSNPNQPKSSQSFVGNKKLDFKKQKCSILVFKFSFSKIIALIVKKKSSYAQYRL